MALLPLVDGRTPDGGHAHSNGMEAAVHTGAVHDIDGVHRFCLGRLTGSGFTAAAAAARAAGHGAAGGVPARWCELNAAVDARTPAAAARAASREQGAGSLRLARVLWPAMTNLGLPHDAHHCVVLGAAAAAALPDRRADEVAAAAAAVVAYQSVVSPAQAAVRLLGLPPLDVAAVTAQLAPTCTSVAASAARYVDSEPDDLPDWGAPGLDILLEWHSTREGYFAS
jgi:urease accessory protein